MRALRLLIVAAAAWGVRGYCEKHWTQWKIVGQVQQQAEEDEKKTEMLFYDHKRACLSSDAKVSYKMFDESFCQREAPFPRVGNGLYNYAHSTGKAGEGDVLNDLYVGMASRATRFGLRERYMEHMLALRSRNNEDACPADGQKRCKKTAMGYFLPGKAEAFAPAKKGSCLYLRVLYCSGSGPRKFTHDAAQAEAAVLSHAETTPPLNARGETVAADDEEDAPMPDSSDWRKLVRGEEAAVLGKDEKSDVDVECGSLPRCEQESTPEAGQVRKRDDTLHHSKKQKPSHGSSVGVSDGKQDAPPSLTNVFGTHEALRMPAQPTPSGFCEKQDAEPTPMDIGGLSSQADQRSFLR